MTPIPANQEPDFATSIADVISEESANEAACGWKSCSGCHETNEGYETGHYPYSKMFGCFVGSGCSECGGIGVVWEYWSKEGLDKWLADDVIPANQEHGVTEAMVEVGLRAAEEACMESKFGDYRGHHTFNSAFTEEFRERFRLIHRTALTAALLSRLSASDDAKEGGR